MKRPQICLTLTGKTLEEDLQILEKYRSYVDMVELRGDFLEEDERLRMREFPEMAQIPCILTIRRKIDGGQYTEGEAARTILFAHALSFADTDDRSKNFEYVDFEEDFHIPSLQDAALAFGTKIIRSVHSMTEPITDICERLKKLQTTVYEIPKIAFMPKTLDDVTNLFDEAEKLKGTSHILLAMGPLGVPTRILSAKLGNYLTFTSPSELNSQISNLAHIDPVTLNSVYHFNGINEKTQVFGVTGWPLKASSSPKIHSQGYVNNKMNAVYIPIVAETIDQAVRFADKVGIKGLSVTVPHKEKVLDLVHKIDSDVESIGASNTIVKNKNQWFAYNTDAGGFEQALLEFTGFKNLAHKKVAIIGAGGAAKAIAYTVKKLKGKCCIFNRTESKAQELAEKYGFKYAMLDSSNVKLLKEYSDVIIQTTTVGMNSTEKSNSTNDPVFFYEFTGKEMVFDIVYVPAVTPVMARAEEAGCKTCNGYSMLQYQAYRQFELYTGEKYDKSE